MRIFITKQLYFEERKKRTEYYLKDIIIIRSVSTFYFSGKKCDGEKEKFVCRLFWLKDAIAI